MIGQSNIQYPSELERIQPQFNTLQLIKYHSIIIQLFVMSVSALKKQSQLKHWNIVIIVLGVILLLNIPFSLYLLGRVNTLTRKLNSFQHQAQYNLRELQGRTWELTHKMQQIKQWQQAESEMVSKQYQEVNKKFVALAQKFDLVKQHTATVEKLVEEQNHQNEGIKKIASNLFEALEVEGLSSKTSQMKRRINEQAYEIKDKIKSLWSKLDKYM